ncbi:MAG: hypothetical protein HYY96_07060 [Candidatus Tectomicrobia bacterium]|nr:hypothetical protein [Candidatus Tectomicrobia bacterium]
MAATTASRRWGVALLLVIVAAALSGCATTASYQAPAPLHARPDLRAAVDGAVLLLAVERWTYPPYDLPGVVTPIGLLIRNERQAPIQIRLIDFRLRDARGFQFAALPPSEVAQYYALRAETPPARGWDARLAVTEARRAAPVVALTAHPFFRRGFRYDPFYDPFWGPYRYYDPYWYGVVRNEVTVRGLQPALLQPGATATGFLYFQRSGGEAGTLHLEWDVPQFRSSISQTLSLTVPPAAPEGEGEK